MLLHVAAVVAAPSRSVSAKTLCSRLGRFAIIITTGVQHKRRTDHRQCAQTADKATQVADKLVQVAEKLGRVCLRPARVSLGPARN